MVAQRPISGLGQEIGAIDGQAKAVNMAWGPTLRAHHRPIYSPYWDIGGSPVFVGPASG